MRVFRSLMLALALGASAVSHAQDAAPQVVEKPSLIERVKERMQAHKAPKIQGALPGFPPPYDGDAVKPGEFRSSAIMVTSAITANGNAAFAQTKLTHPVRAWGVKVTCVSRTNAVCSVPPVTHNGKPLTDQVYLPGRRVVYFPLSEQLALDTSDSITLQSNASIVGLASPADDTYTSYVVVEFTTLRSFQAFEGAE